MKDYRIDYTEQLIETIKFDESEDSDENELIEQETDASVPIIQFELIQIIAKTDQGQNAVLTARMVK